MDIAEISTWERSLYICIVDIGQLWVLSAHLNTHFQVK